MGPGWADAVLWIWGLWRAVGVGLKLRRPGRKGSGVGAAHAFDLRAGGLVATLRRGCEGQAGQQVAWVGTRAVR